MEVHNREFGWTETIEASAESSKCSLLEVRSYRVWLPEVRKISCSSSFLFCWFEKWSNPWLKTVTRCKPWLLWSVVPPLYSVCMKRLQVETSAIKVLQSHGKSEKHEAAVKSSSRHLPSANIVVYSHQQSASHSAATSWTPAAPVRDLGTEFGSTATLKAQLLWLSFINVGRTKQVLKEAYATSHLKVVIYTNKVDRRMCAAVSKVWAMWGRGHISILFVLLECEWMCRTADEHMLIL